MQIILWFLLTFKIKARLSTWLRRHTHSVLPLPTHPFGHYAGRKPHIFASSSLLQSLWNVSVPSAWHTLPLGEDLPLAKMFCVSDSEIALLFARNMLILILGGNNYLVFEDSAQISLRWRESLPHWFRLHFGHSLSCYLILFSFLCFAPALPYFIDLFKLNINFGRERTPGTDKIHESLVERLWEEEKSSPWHPETVLVPLAGCWRSPAEHDQLCKTSSSDKATVWPWWIRTRTWPLINESEHRQIWTLCTLSPYLWLTAILCMTYLCWWSCSLILPTLSIDRLISSQIIDSPLLPTASNSEQCSTFMNLLPLRQLIWAQLLCLSQCPWMRTPHVTHGVFPLLAMIKKPHWTTLCFWWSLTEGQWW